MPFDQLKRRQFITLLGGAAVFWPLTAGAQPSPIRPLIGVLSPLSAAGARHLIMALRSALRDLGYLEGRNLTLALRYADGAPERLPPLARELVALNPDMIVTGAAGVRAAHNATETIPIIGLTIEDPVASGLADSIARPSRNYTGMWTWGDDLLVGKRFDFLKLAIPGLARVGAILNPDDPVDSMQIPQMPAAVRSLGLNLQIIEVRDASKLDSVATEIQQAGVQGLFVGPSPFFITVRTQITAMAANLKLPAVYGWREFADAGGLMSYGPNLPDMYRQMARTADRIIKGEKPADLPIERPTRYELVVNLKAAKAIGVAIPDSFVLLADEVIE
jgi:putative tryptophan/tyrosine transport system substrate-binding protein